MTIDADLRTGSAAGLENWPQPFRLTEEELQNPRRPPIWRVSNNSYTQVEGIADKFRSHVIIPIVDQATATSTWTALVPGTVITEQGVSVDRINDIISSQAEWNVGDAVTDTVTVRAKIGTHGLLLSTLQTDKSQQNTSVHLDESGSSANVSLVVRPDGGLEVHKTCSHDGIDENGRPWLERQNRFLETSIAVKETDIFVRPLRYTATDDHFSIDFPYLPSQTLAQLAMAGMGGELLLDVTSELLGEMAVKVWPKTATEAPVDFIEKAHFDRIDRRVAIARAAVPELGAIVDSAEVVVNGRTLLGFHAVMAQLRAHPAIAAMAPTLIGEIHGDLNLHNILCCVGAEAQRQVTLIDPRGVHLLSDFAKTRDFEPGDYAYELSKLKFSLSAFSEIRHGYLTLQQQQQQGGGGGMDFKISFAHHSGSETMRSADAGFFGALAQNEPFMDWVQRVEPRGGFDALRHRVLLGEAANFVADAACALGRDTVHEVIPLFLIGLDKLNSVLALLNDTIAEHKLDDWFARPAAEDTSAGLLGVQESLLLPRYTVLPWDVIELTAPAGQVAMTALLVESLRAKCFPCNTPIYTSSTIPSKVQYPHILIHGVDATSSPTEALLSGVSQANIFWGRDEDSLRIVSIQPPSVEIGEAAGGGFARQGNRLLAPGPWGASPLQLVLLTAQQMRFARPGRFIVDDTSCALLTKEVYLPDVEMAVLLSSPAETDRALRPSEVALRTAMGKLPQDVTDVVGSPNTPLASGIFIAREGLAALEKLVADGIRPRGNILTDVVLGSKLDKDSWVELYCSFGFAKDKADLAWDAAQRLSVGVSSEPTSYSSGGDKVSMYRFGSLEEYKWLTTEAKKDSVVNSLAFMAATLAWREQWTDV